MKQVVRLIKEIDSYLKNFDEKKFLKAFNFAKDAHRGQLRKSNEPYIDHPIQTVKNLISIRADEDSLIAGLLHDVPEDTEKTIKEIEEKFGKKVAFLVEGVTKFSLVHYQYNATKRQFDSIKNMLLHSAKDFRVMIIKLADRLHNMKTLDYLNEEKRIKVSKETLEIYVPIANLLGLQMWKEEIEDLCFRYLLPNKFKLVSDFCSKNKNKIKNLASKLKSTLNNEFKRHNIRAKIRFRSKNYYQIFNECSFDISDEQQSCAFRADLSLYLIIQSKSLCYTVLGIIHSIFKPRLGFFKDFIALPKNNGYQSLHTSVFTDCGIPANFIIRTPVMDLESLYGIAASNFYKYENDEIKNRINPKLEWIKDILEVERDHSDVEDFFDDIKEDLFQDRIFVYTPKGHVIDLPNSATAIDFAYLIHTDLGHKAHLAEINGHVVPLSTTLSTGDVVKIIISPQGESPRREWISVAHTNKAKHKIRNWFKKESSDKKIKIGKSLLLEEFERAGLKHIDHISDRKIKGFLQLNNLVTLNDLYVCVAEGAIESVKVANYLLYNPKKLASKKKEIKEKMINIKLKVIAKDDVGAYHKILSSISGLGINLLNTKAYTSLNKKDFVCKLILEVPNLTILKKLFIKIREVEGVKFVKRIFWGKRMLFCFVSLFTFFVWICQPFYINYISAMDLNNKLLYTLTILFGFGLLAVTMLILKRVFKQNLFNSTEVLIFSGIVFVLNIIAIGTIIFEVLYYNIEIHWLATLIILILFISDSILDILNTKKSNCPPLFR